MPAIVEDRKAVHAVGAAVSAASAFRSHLLFEPHTGGFIVGKHTEPFLEADSLAVTLPGGGVSFAHWDTDRPV